MEGSRSLTRGTSSAKRRTFFPSPARRARAKTLMRRGVYRRAMTDQRLRVSVWGSGSGDGPGVAGMGAADEFALQPLDLVLELVHHEIHGHRGFGGGRLGPDGVAVAGHGDLTDLAGDSGAVAVGGELDLGSLEDGGQPGQPGQLGLGYRADLVGDCLFPTEHKNIHYRTSSTRAFSWELSLLLCGHFYFAGRVRLTWSLSPHSPA